MVSSSCCSSFGGSGDVLLRNNEGELCDVLWRGWSSIHFDDTCTNFCINPRTSLCVSLGRCFDSLVVYRRAEKSMKAYKASALAKRGGIFR